MPPRAETGCWKRKEDIMETIESFLNTKHEEQPSKGDAGEFSGWLPFHKLELRGNALQFVEKRVLGIRGEDEYECIEIPASPGTFFVECRGVRFGSDARVAAMRAFPEGTTVERGQKIGDIPVDLGGVSVVDISAIENSINENEEDYEEWMEEILFNSESESLVSVDEWLATSTKIPSVEGGFGDGSYDVYELLFEGKRVGLEIVFIEENDKYPF